VQTSIPGIRSLAVAALTLVLGTVVYAAVVADLGQTAFAGIVAVLVLAAFILVVREAVRGRFGAAVAWGWTGYPFVLLLVLIAIPLAHISRLLGDQSCDPFAMDCGPLPPGTWVPLVFFLVSAVTGFVGILKVRSAGKGSE
jgi:hypothetical protein